MLVAAHVLETFVSMLSLVESRSDGECMNIASLLLGNPFAATLISETLGSVNSILQQIKWCTDQWRLHAQVSTRPLDLWAVLRVCDVLTVPC